MHRASIIISKIAVRLIIAIAFTVFWYFSGGRNVSPSAPLVFFGALWLAGAWFSYLKRDGVSVLNKGGIWRFRSEKMESKINDMLEVRPHEARLLDSAHKPDPAHGEIPGILANVLSGVVLIAVSFFF